MGERISWPTFAAWLEVQKVSQVVGNIMSDGDHVMDFSYSLCAKCNCAQLPIIRRWSKSIGDLGLKAFLDLNAMRITSGQIAWTTDCAAALAKVEKGQKNALRPFAPQILKTNK